MTPRQQEDLATEQSNLLNKNLSNSSMGSIEEIQKDLEVQIQTIRKNWCDRSLPFANKRNLLLSLLVALFTVLVLGIASGSSWGGEGTNIDVIDNLPIDGGARFPLSQLDPVHDLKLSEHGRPRNDPSFPSYYYAKDADRPFKALPTNAWYQNILQAPVDGEPANVQRIYPGPYLLDVVGTIPGLRIHVTDIVASDMVMQLTFIERFNLVLGATKSILSSSQGDDNDSDSDSDKGSTNRYQVLETTELGVTLEWEATNMTSNLVKGMSYVTMEYQKEQGDSSDSLLPTIAAQSGWENPIMVDGEETVFDCSQKVRVEKDIELYFQDSDYSWMAFFSEPVFIGCSIEDGKTLIQVLEYDEEATSEIFVTRLALIDQCTNGFNGMSCRTGLGYRTPDEPKKEEYVDLLRAHADAYPGSDTSFSYVMPEEEGDNKADLIFDWDVKSMSDLSGGSISNNTSRPDLLTFAIPHQMERLSSTTLPNNKRYCKSSIVGPACLVQGAKWVYSQDLPEISFRAKRPPKPEYIPTLANALSTDIEFQIPDYFQRGAGDTYFSGKILAKLARILLIAEEVEGLCGEEGSRDYLELCLNSTLPSEKQVEDSIKRLREGVEVWINGKAVTPLVYDTSWGGVVSCGCYMVDDKCTNRYPNCPGFGDPGLNFGNGFYNDHHFHYGYHIFAAAVVAHYDPEWGMNNFENVLLLVRDIANPSENDAHFPLFRHKDWYQGSSWASGIVFPAFLNGKNQESSSEAIAAYEGVALFGQVMTKIWQEANHTRYAATSKEVANVGRLMTGTELVSAKRYWQISDDKKDDKDGTQRDDTQRRIYSEQYSQHVVGILWQTMAQFSTWFGAAPYLPIGIQLLPLTPISEDRDGIEWMNAIYEPFTQSCATNFDCTESGWSILQLATLATVGYAHEAAQKLKELPDEAFENAGGNGHSRSNTAWFIATRPVIENPIPMVQYDKRGKEEVRPKALYELEDCYVPDTCTDEVLDQHAGEYTCRDRISFMIHSEGLPQWQACSRVAGLEFVDICGPCNPNVVVPTISKKQQAEEEEGLRERCPLCTETECNSQLNRCPFTERTFVCTEGTNKGGCSGDHQIWVNEDQCDVCCEMTECFGLKDNEAKKFTKDGNVLTKASCPPCPPDVCYGKENQCPIHTAPYLCTRGPSTGGCSSHPWETSDSVCTGCCEIKVDC